MIANNKKNNVVLIDANAFVHKSFHGYEPTFSQDKEDVKILHGLIQALYDSVKNIDKIDYLYYVFDSDTSSDFRKSIFPAYKENRPPTDPELCRQRIRAKSIISNEFGFPLIEYPGYEADDVIGTMAKYYEKTHNVIIVTPDKDIFQLINDSVLVLRPRKENNRKFFEYITANGVQKYFGVNPHQIPDFLALVGDRADNLPGINNLGKVTASNLLNMYESIEHIYTVIDDLINTNNDYCCYLKDLKDNIDMIRQVRFLATIKTDLKLQENINQCILKAQEIQGSLNYKGKAYNLIEHYNLKPYLLDFLFN